MITRIEYVDDLRHRPNDDRRSASIMFYAENDWRVYLYLNGQDEGRSPASCRTLTSAQGKARAWVNGWLGKGRKQ